MRPRETRGFALAECELAGFDRQHAIRCRVQRPDRYRLLSALPADLPRIARGGGVSYVAASFDADAVSQDLSAFDRVLAFDETSGRIVVEAGMRVGHLQRFALARGWYLPVAPGHPRASIGGCIAADVHGKNPARDGTFRAIVDALEIEQPEGGAIAADRMRNTELFEATFAGFGLTGLVTRATVRLARAPAAWMVRRLPVRNLAEAARVLREAGTAPLLYGWHDGRAGHFGRGVIRVGLTADAADARAARLPTSDDDLPAAIRPLPVGLWSHAGIAWADRWLTWRWCREGRAPMPLAEALFPLNRARGYFAAYGPAGMAEAQWLVPHARFEAFASLLGDAVARLRPRIALIASKLFAGVAQGLSFDGNGIALALQVPAPAEATQRRFLETLAELAIAHGGRPNLIKDSTLDAATVRAAIPGFETARARLALFNPQGWMVSHLSRRLGL